MMSVEHEGAHVHRHVILFILGDSSTHFKAHSHNIIWRQKHRWCAMVGDSSDCDAKQCCFMKLGSRRHPPKWRECQLKTWCEVLSFCRFVCVRLSFPVCRLSFVVCSLSFLVCSQSFLSFVSFVQFVSHTTNCAVLVATTDFDTVSTQKISTNRSFGNVLTLLHIVGDIKCL